MPKVHIVDAAREQVIAFRGNLNIDQPSRPGHMENLTTDVRIEAGPLSSRGEFSPCRPSMTRPPGSARRVDRPGPAEVLQSTLAGHAAGECGQEVYRTQQVRRNRDTLQYSH